MHCSLRVSLEPFEYISWYSVKTIPARLDYDVSSYVRQRKKITEISPLQLISSILW